MSELKTMQEISKELRVTTKTVRNWIEQGILKAYKFGSQYRVELKDYEEFLSKSKIKGEQENE